MPYTQLADLQTLTLSNNVQCDNPCCILTLNCNVTLMGNMTLDSYIGYAALATLPESMRPIHDIAIPVYLGTTLVKLIINSDGELSIPASGTGDILYLNGVTFNVCDRYYNNAIGNNFSQGTSPMRWDGGIY